MTTALGLSQSAFTISALPTAATTMSALLTTSFIFRVFECAITTVASRSSNRKATGIPTIFERPITTAVFPLMGIPQRSSSAMQPCSADDEAPTLKTQLMGNRVYYDKEGHTYLWSAGHIQRSTALHCEPSNVDGVKAVNILLYADLGQDSFLVDMVR
eukprot:scaffold2428_cov412-Prasinococcus_capsulatus_cf.AAC.17